MTAVRCVVFDIDDTLYLERDYVKSGFEAVSEHLLRTHGVDGFFQRAWKLFESGHRGSTFDVVLSDMGMPGALVPELVGIYREHTPTIRLLSDARAAIEALRGRVHIAIISDGPVESQASKVAALGLEQWCEPIILTGAYGPGFGKPHPRAYEDVERVLGVRGRQCAYIADNPAKDFQAPHALGWRRLRVRRARSLHEMLDSDSFADVECLNLDPAVKAILAGEGWPRV